MILSRLSNRGGRVHGIEFVSGSRFMMVVTQALAELPSGLCEQPHIGKAACVGLVERLAGLLDVKIMLAGLNGAVEPALVVQSKDLDGARDGLPDRLARRGAANAVLESFQEFRTSTASRSDHG